MASYGVKQSDGVPAYLQVWREGSGKTYVDDEQRGWMDGWMEGVKCS